MAGRSFSTRVALRAMFGLQMGIAAVLLAQGFAAVAPDIRWPSAAPSVTRPVSPGDQTRRFRPSEITRPAPAPGTPMPATHDLPRRLHFEERPGGGVQLVGEIREGDAARFAEWLDRQDPAPARLWLHSPGGSVGDALEIGRLIRARGIATGMAAGDVCLSACPYILMAGGERQVHEGAKVGVHQHYYGESSVLPAFLAVEDIQRSQSRVIGYLSEMGIGLELMEHSLATPPDEIYILVPEELTGYGVATEMVTD